MINSSIAAVDSKIVNEFNIRSGIEDANQATTGGVYGTTNLTLNLPLAAIGILIVFVRGGGYMVQLFAATYSSKMYFRTQDLDRWMSWVALN